MAGNNQYFRAKMPKGGTAMFAFFALAGDFGAAIGPAMVGSIADVVGGNLKTGLLFATVFSVLMIGSYHSH